MVLSAQLAAQAVQNSTGASLVEQITYYTSAGTTLDNWEAAFANVLSDSLRLQQTKEINASVSIFSIKFNNIANQHELNTIPLDSFRYHQEVIPLCSPGYDILKIAMYFVFICLLFTSHVVRI